MLSLFHKQHQVPHVAATNTAENLFLERQQKINCELDEQERRWIAFLRMQTEHQINYGIDLNKHRVAGRDRAVTDSDDCT